MGVIAGRGVSVRTASLEFLNEVRALVASPQSRRRTFVVGGTGGVAAAVASSLLVDERCSIALQPRNVPAHRKVWPILHAGDVTIGYCDWADSGAFDAYLYTSGSTGTPRPI